MRKHRSSVQRKALRRGKNLAFSEDTCLEKERVWSKVTPRKVGVGLKRRREPSRRRLGWRLAWWGSTEKEASHLLGLRGRHQYSHQCSNRNRAPFVWITLLFTLILTVFLHRNTPLFFFHLQLLFIFFGTECGQSSHFFRLRQRHPQAWRSSQVEEAVSETGKAFVAAHKSDEDRQAYISASRHASCVIAKAKAKSWRATCSSLSLSCI